MPETLNNDDLRRLRTLPAYGYTRRAARAVTSARPFAGRDPRFAELDALIERENSYARKRGKDASMDHASTRVCEGCGCTDAHACVDSVTHERCAWVDAYPGDMCSTCASVARVTCVKARLQR